MKVRRFVIPGAAALAWFRVLSDEQKENIRSSLKRSLPDTIGPLVVVNRRSGFKRSLTVLGLGAFIGALVAYFFDPDRGRGRRAKVKDMTGARVRRASDEARKARVRVENKAQGVRAELQPRVGEVPNDPTLAQKIRSEVLRDFPSSVDVVVEEGRAVLRGTLESPSQIKELEAAVSTVPGVIDVENLTHLPGASAPRRAVSQEPRHASALRRCTPPAACRPGAL